MREAPAAIMASRSKPSAAPGGGRHAVGQGGQEILVHRPILTVQRVPPGAVGGEAGALFGGVGQFLERVGQFHAAEEELEPQGGAGVGGIPPGERRLGGRPMRQEGRVVAAELRLDAFQEQAEEEVLPVLAGAQPGAGLGGQRGSVAGRAQQVGAGIAGEGVLQGQALERG